MMRPMAAGFKGLGLRALRYDPTSRVPGSNFSILDANISLLVNNPHFSENNS